MLRVAILFLLSVACGEGRTQALPERTQARGLTVGLRFTATESNAPPGTCGCFWLVGGAADAGLPLWRNFSGVVEVGGNHAGSVPQTTRALSTITLLAGPRYSVHLPERQGFEVQALFGAVRGFDAAFVGGHAPADTSTAFAVAVGAAYTVTLRKHLSLRPLQVEYVQTALPNGADDRQRDVRLSTGVVFHPSLPGSAR